MARAFVKSLREGGSRPVLLLKGGTADFNLAARWDCPMVAYGPGDSRLDHSADERLDMVELDRSVEVMARALTLFMEGLEK
jgi:LysW-gamma-L-lysine carboxypeptidase